MIRNSPLAWRRSERGQKIQKPYFFKAEPWERFDSGNACHASCDHSQKHRGLKFHGLGFLFLAFLYSIAFDSERIQCFHGILPV
ncbi:hypothetical protein L596_009743 [Steinernema carpocapsae]|uniref:Uncharacterized protein n=1 Tax=Steinernema carpocapsae TaxID=34508 RepID=A0A4U5PGJ8_STECR|nr:hypothetical protein L596_009743 [Steinernema carpocapsae]